MKKKAQTWLGTLRGYMLAKFKNCLGLVQLISDEVTSKSNGNLIKTLNLVQN